MIGGRVLHPGTADGDLAEALGSEPVGVAAQLARCGNPGCRCHADPPQLHGPYLTWTRKVNNKTVTRTLDPGQAERQRPLLDNSRRLHELVHELEALALRHVERDPRQPNR